VALVDYINARRRAKYKKIAARNGTSVDSVGALAGIKLIERAGAGEYVESARGQWTRK
jgi:uncharacterized protein YdbL (DUF1318 family)